MSGGCCARGALGIGLLAILLSTVGCATAKKWKDSLNASNDERKVQREAAISDFETRRTEVQLKAAQDRLAAGDEDDARRALRDILRRQPACRDASLMLAVLEADGGDLGSAERILLAALRLKPADAELHHSLGTMLELGDRLPEAKAHFAEACRLAPKNRVFRDSLASLPDVTPSKPLIAAAPPAANDKIVARIAD